MTTGFHFWQSQPIDRVIPPWLVNLCLPTMSPHTNGTRHLSHWFIGGKIKGGGSNGSKSKRWTKWVVSKKCHTKHVELMQAGLTMLEPKHWQLTDSKRGHSLLLTFHLTSRFKWVQPMTSWKHNNKLLILIFPSSKHWLNTPYQPCESSNLSKGKIEEIKKKERACGSKKEHTTLYLVVLNCIIKSLHFKVLSTVILHLKKNG